jgi:hypothetical protein
VLVYHAPEADVPQADAVPDEQLAEVGTRRPLTVSRYSLSCFPVRSYTRMRRWPEAGYESPVEQSLPTDQTLLDLDPNSLIVVMSKGRV